MLVSWCGRVLQRNRTNRMCVYTHTRAHKEISYIFREREKYMIYFKELARLIVETGKFEICRVGR